MNRWHRLALVAVVALLSTYHHGKPKETGLTGVKACQDNLEQMARAVKEFSVDHNGRYPEALSELVPSYLPLIPNCPSGRDTYSEGFQIRSVELESVNLESFTVACTGSNHRDISLRENLPMFSSVFGLVPDLDPSRPFPEPVGNCGTNLEKIGNALNAYGNEHEDNYPDSLEGLVPDYLSQIPECPTAKTDSYSSGYIGRRNKAEISCRRCVMGLFRWSDFYDSPECHR